MGGKKEQGARTPYEAPNSLSSAQVLRIIDAVAEGELAGFGNGDDAPLKSVFFNDTPVQNADNSFNFKGVEAFFVRGTPDQPYIPGFAATERTVAVGAAVKRNTPIVRAVSNAETDRLRVTVGVERNLSVQENGDTVAAVTELVVELVGATGVAAMQTVRFSEKSSGAYYQDVDFNVMPSVPFNIRVRRNTPDSASDRVVNNTFFASYVEIADIKLSYPHTALAALKIDSDQFGNQIPRRSYLLRGKLLQVPSNYNPETRQYAGIWDGSFKTAWTNNPVWVFYDLLTNPRYSTLARRLTAADIDKWALYEIAKYCDAPVPDGFGGEEPRFVCNAYITDARQAADVLSDLAAAFCALPVWDGSRLSLRADTAAEPVAQYSNANVLDGAFAYAGAALKAVHTAVHVRYADKHDGWRMKTEYVADDAAIARYGLNIKAVTAFGCDSRGQAVRFGEWLLQTELRQQDTVTFSVGREGLRHLPHDVIRIADNDYAGADIGGRVKAVAGNLITLDRAVSAAAGQILHYSAADGSLKTTRIAAQTAPNTLRVESAAALAENAVWALAGQVKPRLYRALSVRENSEDGTYTITALRHDPDKYAAVDGSAAFERSTLHGQAPEVSGGEVRGDSGALALTWSGGGADGDTLAYDIKIYRNGSLYRHIPDAASAEIRLENLPDGDYRAEIRARNARGVWSETLKKVWRISYAIEGLRTTGKTLAVDLAWNLPETVVNTVQTELRYGSSNDFTASKPLATLPYPQNSYTLTGVAVTDTYYFWARLTDADGRSGKWTAAVVGRADTNPAPIVSQIRGAIEKSTLSQALINQLKADDTAAENRAKAAASADAANKVAAEARARAEADRAEAQARAAALQQETQARNAEIRREADKQAAALRAESGKLNTAIASAAEAAQQELTAQVAQLTAKDSELKHAQTVLDGKAAELTRTAQQLGNRIAAAESVNREQATAIQTVTAAHGRTAAALEAEKTARAQGDAAEARARETLAATVGQHTTALSAERQARIDGDAANTRELNTAKSRIADAVSSIGRLEQTVVNNREAAATQISNLTATVEQNRVAAELAKASVDGNVLHIAAPEGGSLSANGTSTGAIKIRLPVRKTSTMLKFRVEIFDYATEKAASYEIAGYNYGGGSWYHPTVVMSGAAANTKNVRFGHDAEKDCVWIGELNSTWLYLKVRVVDLVAGHQGHTAANWQRGWQISVVTAFDTVQHTRNTLNPAKDAAQALADIATERTARVNADNALTQQLDTAKSRLQTAEAALQTEQRTRAEADRAEAAARQTLAGKVDGNTVALAEVREAKADKTQVAALARQTLSAEWQRDIATAKAQAQQAATRDAQAKADAARQAAERAAAEDAQSKVAAAQAATAAEIRAAKEAAAADAQRRADAAKAAAASAAETADRTVLQRAAQEAQAKADAAKRAAETAASADATAKANAAKAQAIADAAAKDAIVKREAAADAQAKADAVRRIAEAAQRAADTVAADLVREQQTRAAGDEANARAITAATARLGTAESGINELRQTTARQNQALAEAQNSLTARIDGVAADATVGGNLVADGALKQADLWRSHYNHNIAAEFVSDIADGKFGSVGIRKVGSRAYWNYCKTNVLIDPARTYRFSAWLRKNAAESGSNYFTWWQIGKRNYGSRRISAASVANEWVYVEQTVRGADFGDSVVNVGFALSHNGGAADVVIELQNYRFEDVTAAAQTAAVAAELTEYKRTQAATDAAQTDELRAAKSQIGQQSAALEQIRRTKADKSEVSAQLQTNLQASARDAQTRADKAQQAAERTAQIKADAARQAAEQAAAADTQSKVAAAQAATAAEIRAAKEAAAADAQRRADAAKAAAASAAETADRTVLQQAAREAQAKADAAKRAAETAASADATAKANAAEARAKAEAAREAQVKAEAAKNAAIAEAQRLNTAANARINELQNTVANNREAAATAVSELRAEMVKQPKGSNLVADGLLNTPSAWYSHYGINLAPYFVGDIADGKLGAAGIRKRGGGVWWIYSHTDVPIDPDRTYLFGVWLRKTGGNSGNSYFTYRRVNRDNYGSFGIAASSLTDGEWVYIQQRVKGSQFGDVLIRPGIALAHTGAEAGIILEAQGYQFEDITEFVHLQDEANAAITAEREARVEADRAQTAEITAAKSQIGNNTAAIDGIRSTKADKTEVAALARRELQSEWTATAQTKADTAKQAAIAEANRLNTATNARVNTLEQTVSTQNSATASRFVTVEASVQTAKNEAINAYKVQDTRDDNQAPSWYRTHYAKRTVEEFKKASAIGLTGSGGTYVHLQTAVKWADSSGGAVHQSAVGDNGKRFARYSVGDNWSAWSEAETVAGAQAKIDSERTARVAADEAQTRELAAAKSRLGAAESGISELRQTVTRENSATATQISNLTATVEQNRVAAELAKASVDGNVLHIAAPEGGALATRTAAVGAIKIRLPTKGSTTMLKFRVEVFDYAVGKSVSYDIAGYTYLNRWINCTASMTGGAAATKTVRFGNDGDKDCVWIGEPNSNWGHLQVRVLDFVGGYANAVADKWQRGWQVSLVTEFGTVDYTANTLNPAKDAAQALADIATERTARVNADNALTQQLNTAKSQIGTAQSQLQTLQSTVANNHRAQSERTAALTAKVGTAEATVRTAQTAVTTLNGKVQAMHTLKVQAVGNRKAVAGIALGADGQTGDSQFVVMANKFALARPGGNTVQMPFVVTTVGGQAQLALAGDMLVDGLIQGKHIAAGQTIRTPKLVAATLEIGSFTMQPSGAFTSRSTAPNQAGLSIDNDRIVIRDASGRVRIILGRLR